mmetsp:Transcript_13677/g.35380  ORF Transcript_13677/g.35380 Transcript_13677/m.35380 type:complete len:289 (+) Transcript_13677:3-869(+)
MRDVGRAVEEVPDAVAAVCLDDAHAGLVGVRADDLAHLAEAHARLDRLHALHQALVGHFDEVLGLLVHVADDIRLVQVAVVALKVGGHVHVDDVPVLQLALVGDAVADDFVHGGAHGLWEVVVVERRRVGIALDGRLVHDAIDLVGGDAGADGGVRGVQDLARQAAHPAQPLDLLGGPDGHGALLLALLLAVRGAVNSVVGTGDVLRHLAGGSDPVRPQLARVGELGHVLGAIPAAAGAVLPVVERLVRRPCLLEAILRAEGAVRLAEDQLLALGTLQLRRFAAPGAR